MAIKNWSDVLRGKPPDLGEKLNIRDSSILYNTPQNLIEHHHSTTPEIDRRIADLEQRSMVFRRLPPGTTCEHIVQAQCLTTTIDDQQSWTTAQFETDCKVLQVMRDSMDPRRFVITFDTLESKRRTQARTLRINGAVIGPSKGDFHGYIPETPYYLQEEDYRAILAHYGHVEEIRFNTIKNRTQRTNGLHFSITLEPGKKVPDVINFEGTQILVINKDSRKRCTYCRNYGHLGYQCQKRKQQRLSNLEARAEIEARCEIEAMEDNDAATTEGINPPAGFQNTNVSTTTSKHPPQQTPRKRNSPVNGHVDMTPTKRYAINSQVNALFQEFAEQTDDESPVEAQELETQYKHYVTQRQDFATQSRTEVVAEHYPTRDPNNLSRQEWYAVTDAINARFRELLIAAFPDNHTELNALYLEKKKNDNKPP